MFFIIGSLEFFETEAGHFELMVSLFIGSSIRLENDSIPENQ